MSKSVSIAGEIVPSDSANRRMSGQQPHDEAASATRRYPVHLTATT
jgi:hypothetical protein